MQQVRERSGQTARSHRLVGTAREVENVLRSSWVRGDLVRVGEPRLYGKRVMVDVTLMEPSRIVLDAQEAEQARHVRQRRTGRIVLTVAVGTVVTAAGVTTVGWVVDNAATVLGAIVVLGGVAGKPLAPVVRAAVRQVVRVAVSTAEERA